MEKPYTEQAIEVLGRLREPYAIIGALLATWGHYEQAVTIATRQIEGYAAIKAQIPNPQRNQRRMSERVGHLVHLIEIYGTKVELRNLHAVLQDAARLEQVRQHLCHEMILVHEDQDLPNVEVFHPGLPTATNAEKRVARLKTYTFAELWTLYANSYGIGFKIKDLAGDIATRLFDGV